MRRPRSTTRRPSRRSLPLPLFVVAAVATAALGLLLPAGPAEAESPSRVAEETADDGVFVGIGRGDDVDEAALMAAVENASFDGLRIVVVVPQDPQPTAKAFARRVQEQTEADAVLVFPEEGPLESYMADELSSSRIRATEAARSLVDPARAVSAFAEEVNSVGETGTPRIIRQVINALLLMALVIGVVIGIEILVDRMRRPAPNAG